MKTAALPALLLACLAASACAAPADDAPPSSVADSELRSATVVSATAKRVPGLRTASASIAWVGSELQLAYDAPEYPGARSGSGDMLAFAGPWSAPVSGPRFTLDWRAGAWSTNRGAPPVYAKAGYQSYGVFGDRTFALGRGEYARAVAVERNDAGDIFLVAAVSATSRARTDTIYFATKTGAHWSSPTPIGSAYEVADLGIHLRADGRPDVIVAPRTGSVQRYVADASAPVFHAEDLFPGAVTDFQRVRLGSGGRGLSHVVVSTSKGSPAETTSTYHTLVDGGIAHSVPLGTSGRFTDPVPDVRDDGTGGAILLELAGSRYGLATIPIGGGVERISLGTRDPGMWARLAVGTLGEVTVVEERGQSLTAVTWRLGP